MSATVNPLTDRWLPRQLPAQLAALGALYRAELESRAPIAATASVGWRLYAVLAFAARLAPLPRLAELTGLTDEQLTAVILAYADEDLPLSAAA